TLRNCAHRAAPLCGCAPRARTSSGVARWSVPCSSVVAHQPYTLGEPQRNHVGPRASIVDGNAQATGCAPLDEIGEYRLPYSIVTVHGGRYRDHAIGGFWCTLQQHLQVIGCDHADERLRALAGQATRGSIAEVERLHAALPSVVTKAGRRPIQAAGAADQVADRSGGEHGAVGIQRIDVQVLGQAHHATLAQLLEYTAIPLAAHFGVT